jgi:predicted MFS family arabinose efflux permease
MFWTGLSLAYYSGTLVKTMAMSMDDISDNIKYEKSLYAMSIFGVGEVTGCFFIGYIIDNFSSKIAAIVDVLLIGVAFIVTLGFIMRNEFGYIAYFMAFMQGF